MSQAAVAPRRRAPKMDIPVMFISSAEPDAESLDRPLGRLAAGSAAALRRAAAGFLAGDLKSADLGCRTAAWYITRLEGSSASMRERLEARALGEHLSVAQAEAPTMVDAVQVYDAYMRIARVMGATKTEMVFGAAPTLKALAITLPLLALPLDDRAALAYEAAWVLESAIPDASATPAPEHGRLPTARLLAPLCLWKYGHHMYGLANRAAAHAIQKAVALDREHKAEEADSALLEAAAHTRALTAAMEMAAAMSRPTYGNDVRETMRRPQLPIELTGFQNLDHRAFRHAIEEALTAFPESFVELYSRSRALALARDELLHFDLTDLERHIALTIRLVHHLPALDEAEDGSAVQALRARYIRRLAEYGRLLEHGATTDDTFDSLET